ncbi:hypothetical protein AB0958_18675 [Streptomyces sp. NPDC006655]|uniref:hypothetical protein n=1 Tax=Streptomyces sp. NPDC006655 TaxID=3156898 RepID=UPI003456E5C6
MARTVPVVASETPGQFLTGALWNAGVKAPADFLLGSGSNGVPRFKGYASTSQSIASGTTDTPITLDSEDYDSDNGHSPTVNSSRYVVQVAGTYAISATLAIAPSATGNRKVGININGVNARGGVAQGSGIATNSWAQSVYTEQFCNVGDYIELVCWQSSGGALTTSATTGFGPMLTVHWISG